MIQRVQSVYLLLVTILMCFLLIRPYAELTLADDQHLTFRTHVIKTDSNKDNITIYKYTIPVVLLVLITGFLSFGNIFLYNKRIVQLRVCLVNAIVLITMLIIMFIYYNSAKSSLTVVHHAFKIPAIFPLLGLIFTLMAYRSIHSDEQLVNSYKRIR